MSKYAASSLHADVAKALFDAEVDLFRQHTRWARVFHANDPRESTEAASDRAGDPRTYSREPLDGDLINDAVWWSAEVPETEETLLFLRYTALRFRFQLPDDVREVYKRACGDVDDAILDHLADQS